MFNNRIDLCDELTGFFDEDRNMYMVSIPWLGRKVVFWLSSSDYASEDDIAGLKKAFEVVYRDRDAMLAKGKKYIRERLLPYIASHESDNEYLSYPEVSVDDFDADYWLTDVYVMGGFGMDSVQFNFNPEDDDERYSEISINMFLDDDDIEYFAGLNQVADDVID